MSLKEEIKSKKEEALEAAQQELKDYPVMPEHYSTMLKHQNFRELIQWDIIAKLIWTSMPD